MAVLKSKQIRGMAPKDMGSKLSELRLELMKETGSVRMGKPTKNTGKIRELKRAIARIQTIQGEERIKQSEGKKN